MVTLNKNYRVPSSGPAMGYMNMNWERSPKVNGKLKLAPHPLEYVRNSQRVLRSPAADVPPPGGYEKLPAFADAELQTYTGPGAVRGIGYQPAFWAGLENKTYAKLFSLIKSDKAGLGVNLAQVGKSIQMIRDRTTKVATMLSQKEAELWAHRRVIRRRLGKTPSDWRGVAQARASDILEGQFGWAPLISDAVATMAILANGVPYSPWLRASRKQPISTSSGEVFAPYFTDTETWEGFIRCTYSVQVEVTNPNLWLLNQLGLINPATVALDAVPWSWVVSMFLNYNQVLNSFTDQAGIELSNISVTYSRDVTHVQKRVGRRTYYHSSQTDQRTTHLLEKSRWLGGVIPRPKLMFHWPKADWNLALIASAVMVQRVNKLNATVARIFGVKPPSF